MKNFQPSWKKNSVKSVQLYGLTESLPLRSKKAVGPFTFSIDEILLNNNEQYC